MTKMKLSKNIIKTKTEHKKILKFKIKYRINISDQNEVLAYMKIGNNKWQCCRYCPTRRFLFWLKCQETTDDDDDWERLVWRFRRVLLEAIEALNEPVIPHSSFSLYQTLGFFVDHIFLDPFFFKQSFLVLIGTWFFFRRIRSKSGEKPIRFPTNHITFCLNFVYLFLVIIIHNTALLCNAILKLKDVRLRNDEMYVLFDLYLDSWGFASALTLIRRPQVIIQPLK